MSTQGPRITDLAGMMAAGLPRLAGWLHSARPDIRDRLAELSRRFPYASADVIAEAERHTHRMVIAAAQLSRGEPCEYPECT